MARTATKQGKPPETKAGSGPSEPPSAESKALQSKLARQALFIVVAYLIAAGAWIAVSDRLLALLVSDHALYMRIGVFKGIAFVSVTGGLLHLLIRRSTRTALEAFRAIERKEEERSRHEEERRRADAIIESNTDAIFSSSLDGTITSWNRGAERIFGFEAGEVEGMPATMMLPPESIEEEQETRRRILRGERVEEVETVRVRKDGSRFPVSLTSSPILGPASSDNAPRPVVGLSNIIRDITARRKIEADAERGERLASTLIECMPGIFCLYDDEGRLLRWNKSFETASGYSKQEAQQLHPLDLIDEADRLKLKAAIREVFAKGESSIEAVLVAKDGRRTPYFLTGRLIMLDGKACLLGVGLDIAKRKHTEQALAKSEERYRTTLDNMIEGCQLIDFEWRYLYLNDAIAIQNRRPNQELLGRRMMDAWPGIESTSFFRSLRRTMEQREGMHEEVELTFPDGHTGCFDLSVQPVPEGIFILSIDITEKKRSERALRDLNEGLERKVVERTADLEAARLRAESADRIKSSFLATMSHELRTPLNSIIGFTGIVLQGLAGPLNDEQQKQLGMVQTSARHLLELINDVLDISKIEAGQLELRLRPFDLRASVERVTTIVAPLAAKKQLALIMELPERLPDMESDQRRVEQILLNLLNNGIKYTDRGSVTLRLSVIGDAAVFEVTDTGIGIDREDFAKLFQPFQQLDSGLHRQHEGTGLGLAICQRLAILLGGAVTVQSVRQRGSVFTVSLPLHPQRDPGPHRTAAVVATEASS